MKSENQINMDETSQMAIQIIHTPFHFRLLVITSEQLRAMSAVEEHSDSSNDDSNHEAEAEDVKSRKTTDGLYLNSLCHGLNQPKPIPVENINSPLVKDLSDGFCDSILNMPCVEQPLGRSCGMACNLNAAFVLQVGSLERLQHGEMLAQFKFPDRKSWSNEDFTVATRIFIDEYQNGAEQISKLSVLFYVRQSKHNAKKNVKN
jgi:hypothetical protein